MRTAWSDTKLGGAACSIISGAAIVTDGKRDFLCSRFYEGCTLALPTAQTHCRSCELVT